jgi:diaminohydroxyphosphoribosylaminopyrimidine deaminase / 5-amino-6-(5-phosphoribosylamino)uracil reductase
MTTPPVTGTVAGPRIAAALGPPLRPEDLRWMGRALELAGRGAGLTSPNPVVGAVVVADGRAVGEGFHSRAGGAHAEAAALGQAGGLARGATLYVTLEPCNHTGRTPPCADAIKKAGVSRVVIGARDVNPRVPGGGADDLAESGIEVTLGCREAEAFALNRVFFTASRLGRPHVTLKWAATLDGATADSKLSSRWITGPLARLEAHRLRSRADAIVVGIGTALADDPALDVRIGCPWPREPFRVVADSHARLPVTARLIGAGMPERALVAVTDAADAERLAALEARGVTVLRCKSHDGRVDACDLVSRLGALDVSAVLVEGGGRLAWAFLEAGLVDRVVTFTAPTLLGGGASPRPIGGAGLLLPEAMRAEIISVRQVGTDWMVEANVFHRNDGHRNDGHRNDGRPRGAR